MSFIQGTSKFELQSSLQLTDFVELLLEPIKNCNHFYLIKLGLHEALVNAVKHGNNLDPAKSIKWLKGINVDTPCPDRKSPL